MYKDTEGTPSRRSQVTAPPQKWNFLLVGKVISFLKKVFCSVYRLMKQYAIYQLDVNKGKLTGTVVSW